MLKTQIHTTEAVKDVLELYDLIMAELEPDLTLARVAHVSDLREGESDLECKDRFERYKSALQECNRRCGIVMDMRVHELREYGKTIKARMKRDARQKNRKAIDMLKRFLPRVFS